jgi:uncharacterized hydrophobic protein (TIGR00271 family)
MGFVKKIFQYNMFRRDDLASFVEKFHYDGEQRQQYLTRFGVLLVLSAVIATYGVLQDSTATVIGAMIIAPLMTPIMGIATALVMGRLDRATSSTITVVLGVIAVVFVAWILSETYFGFISLDTNTQITSRVSPNITDLFIALASGAVAAFAMSRDDISDSLPGAAISIALVPPLAVAGVCLSVGNTQMAGGSLLLFFTNLLSIIIAGSVVLHFLGLSRIVRQNATEKEAAKKVFRAIVVGMLIVVIPLALTSYSVLQTVALQNDAREVVAKWLEGSDYRLISLDVGSDAIDITIAGVGDVPNFATLSGVLDSFSDDIVIIKLDAVQSQHFKYPETQNNNITN